jgi:hypothetical protein
MIAVAVYLLCAITSAACAWLLWRMYRRSRSRLLMWSALSFVGWAINNALVFTDFVLVPEGDLAMVRSLTSCAAVLLLLFGMIWDRE